MIRRDLLNSIALTAIAVAIAACSHDVNLYQPTEEEVMENAEALFGVKIDPNQDWRMADFATAAVAVDGNQDEIYTVKVYSNDPLLDNKGCVLAKGKVKSGTTFTTQFEYPLAEPTLVVGVTDSKGLTQFKKVTVTNGQLKAVFSRQSSQDLQHLSGDQGTPVDIDETPQVWTYVFEDTPRGDYDMNDVVIQVKENAADANKIDVTLCCAGASFDLRVYMGDTLLFNAAGTEVHKVFGQKSGSLINTGKDVDVDAVTTTIAKPANFSYTGADFWLDSPAVLGGVHIAQKGKDPHGMIIPCKWAWPKEYVCISLAYPAFPKFAKNALTTDPTVKAWYKTPNPSKIYTK